MIKYLPFYQDPQTRQFHPELVTAKNQRIVLQHPYNLISDKFGLHILHITKQQLATLSIKIPREPKLELQVLFTDTGLVLTMVDYGKVPVLRVAEHIGWMEIKRRVAELNRAIYK